MQDSFLVRLPKGADLLESITSVFRQRGIPKASFTLIGALTHCVMGYYDQDARQYESREFPGHWEIVSCKGNVSEKDNDIFVHAHIVVAGPDYQCLGGHLMAGSSIFAAELYASPVPGTVPVRTFDEPTGLALWSAQE
jgi:predicted DNA-binding protein with PD1-like motif